ncbi:MAG: bifunctional metallophosphatase/5'-nucleotidase, partial [Leuconostoc citreum]
MATETIHLLHTNDMHSHIENWPRILRFLLQKKQAYQQSYTFDIGDAIDRLNPLTDATMGQANVQLMNGVHYDGVTIGNNEGLVLSHDAMNHLYDH